MRCLGSIALVACCAAAAGQSTGVRGSRLGFVLMESDGSLRPIAGFPASAIVEGPLAVPDGMNIRAVSPSQEFALATAGEGDSLVLLDLRSEPATVRALPVATGKASGVVVSPTGSAALVLRDGGAAGLLLAGLPDAPRQAGTLDWSLLPRPASRFAVSDDARVVVAVVAGDDGDALYRIGPGQQAALLSVQPSVADVAFFDDRRDLVFADRSSDRLWMVVDAPGAAQLLPLAGLEQGIVAPTAVRPLADGRRVAVLHSAGGALSVAEVESGIVRSVTCRIAASALQRLGVRALFRITDPSQTPLWLLDAQGPEPRVLFVPRRGPPRRPRR